MPLYPLIPAAIISSHNAASKAHVAGTLMEDSEIWVLHPSVDTTHNLGQQQYFSRGHYISLST